MDYPGYVTLFCVIFRTALLLLPSTLLTLADLMLFLSVSALNFSYYVQDVRGSSVPNLFIDFVHQLCLHKLIYSCLYSFMCSEQVKVDSNALNLLLHGFYQLFGKRVLLSALDGESRSAISVSDSFNSSICDISASDGHALHAFLSSSADSDWRTTSLIAELSL